MDPPTIAAKGLFGTSTAPRKRQNGERKGRKGEMVVKENDREGEIMVEEKTRGDLIVVELKGEKVKWKWYKWEQDRYYVEIRTDE